MSTRTVVSAALVFLAVVSVQAQVPELINYQGRLVDGTNLVNGQVSVIFRLRDAATGGAILYQDSNTVDVIDGVFAAVIGDDGAEGDLRTALRFERVWIETVVNGVSLSPRERLASVAYAITAGGVTNGAINTGMIGYRAITESKLALNSVSNGQIAANSISGSAIINGTIQFADIGQNGAALGQVMKWNGSAWVAAGGDATNAWLLQGNASTSPGKDFIGTTDAEAFEVHVEGGRALRVEPTGGSPNLIGGHPTNYAASILGAAIAGGGVAGDPNVVDGSYGAVGGGIGNRAGAYGAVAGGYGNTVGGSAAAVGGGKDNSASVNYTTVAGG